MDGLNLCLEVAILLSDYNKVVEDDTCLERILSGIQEIVQLPVGSKRCQNHAEMEEMIRTFESLWEKVVPDKNKYSSSSINFLLKFNSIILRCQSQEEIEENLSFLARFPITFSTRESALTPSVANSWISSMQLLIADSGIFHVIAKFIDVKNIASLSNFPSIFVHKEACSLLAKLAICCGNCDAEMSDLCLQINGVIKTLPTETALEVATKMLNLDYNVAVRMLSSIPLSTIFTTMDSTFLNLSKNGELCLCHLYEAFYTSDMTSHIPDILEDVLPHNSAFKYSTNALLNNATKSAGWKMICSFAAYNHSTKYFSHCLDMIAMPLKANVCTSDSVSNVIHQEWLQVIQHQASRTKVTAVVSHCLRSISKLWKSPRFIKVTNDSILPIMIKSFDLLCDSESKDFKNASFADNWKITEALLNVFIQNCNIIPESWMTTFKNAIICLLQKRNISPGVTQLIYKLILKICLRSKDPEFVENCLNVVVLNFVDIRWEVRDSTSEFFSDILNLFALHNDDLILMGRLILSHSVHFEAMRLLKDPDNFVRASALKLLSDIVKNYHILDGETEESILRACTAILVADTESAPRRFAAFTLLSCMKKMPNIVHIIFGKLKDTNSEEYWSGNVVGEASLHLEVMHAINHALLEDLDWEVKFNSIAIFEYLVRCLRDFSKGNIEQYNSVECHLKQRFSKLLDDCDAAVQEKARSVYMALFPQTDWISPDSEQTKSSVLVELDSLLQEVLVSLKSHKKQRLSHGCHGPRAPTEEALGYDSAALDCY